MVRALPAAPWYLHPAQDPGAWQRLVAGGGLEFAVINVQDGPGGSRDEAYATSLADGCATPLVGYVDVAYGTRSLGTILAEAAAWRSLYQVTAVMLDQVPSVPRQGAWSLDVVDELRMAGVSCVMLNPGTVPHPDLVRNADVTCVFEGSSAAYLRAHFPRWLTRDDNRAVWHLVHSCPPGWQNLVCGLAGRRGAGYVWATAGTLPNPWCRTQESW